LLKETVHAGGQVSRDLLHPSFARLVSNASNVHASRPDVDDEEDPIPNQPESAKHLNREEISPGDSTEVRPYEGVPTWMTTSFRGWF
jgi:hypothetical protein